jgi:hypothetical protein
MSLELIRTILLLCQTEFVRPESIRECVREYIACADDVLLSVTPTKLVQCYLNKAKK